MNESHKSLIVFTLIGQAAVGFLAACFGFDLFIPGAMATHVFKTGLLGAAMLLLIANISALLHLGNKFHAPFALMNLKTSWLSREVVLTGLLTGGVFFSALLSIIRELSHHMLLILFGGFTVIGLMAVYCMSRLYMIPTMRGWNHAITLLEFYSTTLLLGTLTYLSLLNIPFVSSAGGLGQVESIVKGTVIVLATFKFVLIPYDMSRRSRWPRPPRTLTPLWTDSKHWFITRCILLFCGICLFNISQWTGGPGNTATLMISLIPGMLLILFSEILGRFLFYHANEKNGLG